MEEHPEYKVYTEDFSKYPDNKYEYTFYNIKCLVVKIEKCWNGYVEILIEISFDEEKLDVHGGITYSTKTKDSKFNVIGFDTMHFQDYIPHIHHDLEYLILSVQIPLNCKYRTHKFVKDQLRSLVEQIVDMREFNIYEGSIENYIKLIIS